MQYDLLIIGGGPAGVAAGVYAGRKQLKTALITDYFGGQSLVSADIQNWIGMKSVSGFDLGRMLEEHVREQETVTIHDSDLVASIKKEERGFALETKEGKHFEAKTVLITSGSRRRRLGVPGEDKLDGKGVVYCSTCDAPLFKDKTVAVVGGGNAGLEAVIDLFPYATKIYLLDMADTLRGDPVTQEKIKASPKVEMVMNAKTQEILGDAFVSGLTYKDIKTGEVKTLELQGVFVEIGAVPNSEFVKGLVEINQHGEIVVDHKTQRSSLLGIWAAGDASDVIYKQNNVSVGDAVKAILNINDYLNSIGNEGV